MAEAKSTTRTKTATKPATKAATKTRAAAKAKPVAKKNAGTEAETNPLQAPFFDALGERNGEVDLPKAVFDEKPNMPVMHQAYLRQLANARQGTASTKTRGAVSGGGAKPYRQKGTGRARHGSIREPSMKGGGTVFGPHPRSYEQRMPKQMRRLALRSALSQKALDGQVRVIESFVFDEPKTRQASDLMEAMGLDKSALIVLPAPNVVVSRSFENLSGTKTILARNMNIRDLFTHTYLLLSKDCLDLLEENFRARERNGK